MYLSELGDGWVPAILNTQVETDFIRQAQKGLTDDRSYWIGGSTNTESGSIIDLNACLTDNTGEFNNPIINTLIQKKLK